MHKRIVLLLLVVLSLGIFAPTSAQIATDKFGELTVAAQFFPSNTPVFASIRLDDGYLNTLNGLFVTVQERLGLPNVMTLPDVFNDVLGEFEKEFEADVRVWLGDYMSVGMFSPDNLMDSAYYTNDIYYGVLVQITNREAATTFVRDTFSRGNPESVIEEASDDFTLFRPNSSFDPTRLVVTDTYLIVTNNDALIVPTPIRGNLLNSRAFSNTLNTLPAEQYNLFAYIDFPTIYSYVVGSSRRPSNNERLMGILLPQVMGPFVIAGTIEGDALTLDAVISAGNPVGLQALGLQMPTVYTLDASFADVIPSDAIFAIHGTRIGGNINTLRENLVSVVRYFTASDLNPERDAKLQAFALEAQTVLERIVDGVVANVFGVSIQQDLGNWMSRDYALFLRANPEIDNPMFPVDMAMVFQVADGAQSQASIQRLVRSLPIHLRAMGVRNVIFREEQLAGADALFVSLYSYAFDEKPLLELVISANESVFVIGTERAVTDVLTGNTGGAFPQSQAYILPNANIVLYQNLPLALPAYRWISSQLSMRAQDQQIIAGLLNVLGEGVISTTMTENGALIIRATEILNLGNQRQTGQ